jgi:signal peptidase I
MSRKDASFSDGHALKCELAAEVLRSSGTLRLKVTGSSMLPTVFPGDTLIVEQADFANARAGDIVLVSRDARLFAHRLVDKIAVADRSAAVTKGDSMADPDPLVDGGKVLGRVSSILRNGETLQPRRKLRLSERAVAALVQRSEMAGRVVVGVHGFRSPAPNHKS